MNDPGNIQTIEDFAELSAALDAGHAAPSRILATVGIDDAEWPSLRARWLQRFTGDGARELALRFGRAYGRARQQAFLSPSPEAEAAPEPDPLHQADDARPVDQPTIVDDPNRTSDRAFPLAGPATPFRNAACLPATFSLLHAQPAPRPAPPNRRAEPTEATLDGPCTPCPERAALPFAARDGAAPARHGRLQRFDAQTGRLLDRPVWVDDES